MKRTSTTNEATTENAQEAIRLVLMGVPHKTIMEKIQQAVQALPHWDSFTFRDATEEEKAMAASDRPEHDNFLAQLGRISAYTDHILEQHPEADTNPAIKKALVGLSPSYITMYHDLRRRLKAELEKS